MMNTCKWQGEDYSEGAEVCMGANIMRCVSGAWEPTGATCIDETALTSNAPFPEIVPNLSLPCVRAYVITGKPGAPVGFVNNCDECKVAAINIVHLNGTHEIQHFRIEAHKTIEVSTMGTSRVEIIDEKSC